MNKNTNLFIYLHAELILSRFQLQTENSKVSYKLKFITNVSAVKSLLLQIFQIAPTFFSLFLKEKKVQVHELKIDKSTIFCLVYQASFLYEQNIIFNDSKINISKKSTHSKYIHISIIIWLLIVIFLTKANFPYNLTVQCNNTINKGTNWQ